jgi:hypothetical protein
MTRFIPVLLLLVSCAEATPEFGQGIPVPLGPLVQAPRNPCVAYADLVPHLASEYSEHRIAAGLADNGALMELFTSDDSETWTILYRFPNGVACLVSTGKTFVVEPIRGPGT